MFLLGAAAAGVLAGRLTSGVRAAHSGDGRTGGDRGTYAPGANYVDPTPTYAETVVPVDPVAPGPAVTGTTGTSGTTGTATPGSTPLPPPPYGTVPPAGSVVPPTAPAGWDDPTRRPGGVS
jgi:hypothetical protein